MDVMDVERCTKAQKHWHQTWTRKDRESFFKRKEINEFRSHWMLFLLNGGGAPVVWLCGRCCLCKFASTHARTHTHTHTHTHTPTPKHKHRHKHTNTHTQMHTQTHTWSIKLMRKSGLTSYTILSLWTYFNYLHLSMTISFNLYHVE